MKISSKVSLGLAILGICSVGLSRSAAAQTVANGSFESPIANNTNWDTISSGLTGWTINNGTVDLIKGYWQPQAGSQSLDLSGGSPGSISQVINGLHVGTTYNISFYLASNPDGGLATQALDVSFGGSPQTFSYTKNGNESRFPDLPNSKIGMNWTLNTFTTTATATSQTLSFAANPANGFYGPALDNVSITAVTPEASGVLNLAGALLAPGLGMVMLRRRSRKNSASLAA